MDQSEKLKKAREWCAEQFKERIASDMKHPSFLASDLLAEAGKLFEIEHFGVEGHAHTMTTGFNYLNTGDAYDETLVVVSGSRCAHFIVGNWAAYANPGFVAATIARLGDNVKRN